MRPTIQISAFAVLLFLASVPGAQCELERLSSYKPTEDAYFGHSVAIHGDLAAICAPGIASVGRVFVFRQQQGLWLADQVLTPVSTDISFGRQVVMDGDILAFGALKSSAMGPDSWYATIYVYERVGGAFVFLQELISETPGYEVRYTTLDIDGDRIVVGAFGFPNGVFVFDRGANGMFSQTALLIPSDLSKAGDYGMSASVSGGTVLVSAPEHDHDPGQIGSGAIWSFEEGPTGFVEVQEITGETGTGFWTFGYGLDHDGDLALVALSQFYLANKVLALSRQAGVWSLTQQIDAPAGTCPNSFGRALEVRGTEVFIGVAQSCIEGPRTVHHLVHAGGTWSEAAVLSASTDGLHTPTSLTSTLAYDGETLLLGASDMGLLEAPGLEHGAAYLFDPHQGACLSSDTGELSLSDGGTQSLDINASGAHAGEPYLLFGTVSGSSPGFFVGAVQIPLNFDALTSIGVLNPNQPPYSGSFGILDGDGLGAASFTLPPAFSPWLAGLVVHHAFVTFDVPGSGYLELASNPEPLVFVP